MRVAKKQFGARLSLGLFFFLLNCSSQRAVLTVTYHPVTVETAALQSNMPTMCLKVIVSWLLLTLNSAEFYIYCLRINRFKAWPISAPAYFSPSGAPNAASFAPLSRATDWGITSTAFSKSRHYKRTPETSRCAHACFFVSMNGGKCGREISLRSLRLSFIELSGKCYLGQLFFCPDIKS